MSTARTAPIPVLVPAPQVGTPEISLAPLIDVVFLLLIFFMVTTVFPDERGFTIEQPEARQTEPLPTDSMIFLITEDGRIAYGEHTIMTDDVERLVRARLQADPATRVLLRVDRRAATEVLIRVMDAAKLGGVRHVGIAADAVDPRQ